MKKFFIPDKNHYKIMIIGCGGTGSFLAHAIARIAHETDKEISITLVDGDTVEEKNIGRQNFYYTEIGQNKAEILAERLSFAFGLQIKAFKEFLYQQSSNKLKLELSLSDIIISAVDSAKSRQEIDKILKYIHENRVIRRIETGHLLWIDTGNEFSYGQIILGNSYDTTVIKNQMGNKIGFLPYPSISEPMLTKTEKDKTTLSCADLINLGEQSTTINNLIASVTASIVHNLINQIGTESYNIIVNEEIPAIFPKYIDEIIETKEKPSETGKLEPAAANS